MSDSTKPFFKSGSSIIPYMDNPLGRYWNQPSRSKIFFDLESMCYMNEKTFKELPEYSTSIPTGVYEGKMWKSYQHGRWYLAWYGVSKKTNNCSINYKKIIIF